MSALTRKLWRDLWHMRGQVLAVSLVAAVGVANLVMSRATLESLQASRERYYRENAFADVFADVVRAPESVSRRLAEIPGVTVVDTRIVAFGRAELAGFTKPIRVQAVSTPDFEGPRLNRLHIRSGRMAQPGEKDVVVVSDAFAQAHGLHPGDALTLILHGRKQAFRIVGVGATPEFVAQMAPAAVFPDTQRFVVVWMPRRALEAAMDMDGAFNSATFALAPHARLDQVIADIDVVLSRYGGVGAIGRVDQRSHRYLSEELRQLATMARIFPGVFLGVSAFVLYVVLGRLVGGQREQIGTLKAFGYEPAEIWRHYAGFAAVVGVFGTLLGLALGARLGAAMANLYREFYRLPFLDFRLSAGVILLALAVSLGSALLGAAVPVFRAARLPPADAMRPEIPWQGTLSRWVRRSGLRRLDQSHRLIVRNLQRRPFRTLLTCIGLATGTAVMIMARFQHDAIDNIVERQFMLAERHDISVAFIEPQSRQALHELAALPGVITVEGERAVPVRVRYRAAHYRTVVRGLSPESTLRRPLDRHARVIQLPVRGVVLTDYLAGFLDAHPGDPIELETMEGRRRTLQLPLAGVVGEPFGSQAYLPIASLDRAMGEGERISGAVMTVDSRRLPALFRSLDAMPTIAGVDDRRAGIRNFYEGMANTILTFTLIATLFGVVITAGVIYSSARVSLSERSRDLASLRILGFTSQEVDYLLLGELAFLTVLAIPLGFVFSHALIALLIAGYDSDLFRIPHYVAKPTYAVAGVTTLVTAVLCGAMIRRRVARLDLIAVLKARD